MRVPEGNTNRLGCSMVFCSHWGWRIVGLSLLRLTLVLVNLSVLTWPRTLQAGVNEWTPIGLAEEYVRNFVINPVQPHIQYAGTNTGLFKSTNGGENWTATTLTVPVYSLAMDPTQPNTLYAGSGVVYKSTNGGESWTYSSGTDCWLDALAINPVQSNILYAGTLGCGVFKSTNGGGSFTPANEGLTNPYISAIVINPFQPATLYAGTSGCGSVFKSTNGGESWGAFNTGLPDCESIYALAIDPTQPAILYAGTYSGVFKSTNGGENWTAFSTGLPIIADITALVIDPTQPTTLYAGTFGNGVFKSTNGGGSWAAMNTGLPQTRINTLAIDPTGTNLYAGEEGGAFSYQPSATLTPMLDLLLLQ